MGLMVLLHHCPRCPGCQRRSCRLIRRASPCESHIREATRIAQRKWEPCILSDVLGPGALQEGGPKEASCHQPSPSLQTPPHNPCSALMEGTPPCICPSPKQREAFSAVVLEGCYRRKALPREGGYGVRTSSEVLPQLHSQNVLSPSNPAAPAQSAQPSPSCIPFWDRHEALLAPAHTSTPVPSAHPLPPWGFSPMVLMVQPSGQRYLGSRPRACTSVPSHYTPTPPPPAHPTSILGACFLFVQ